MDQPELIFQRCPDEEFGLVNRFYKANGHKGKCGRSDLVFCARKPEGIVAAVRLTPKGNHLLLRGLWVATHLRSQGIGSQLLSIFGDMKQTIWCYPYAHLRDFYTAAGFTEVLAEEVPEAIAAPWKAYRYRGEDFLLMVRLPDAAPA